MKISVIINSDTRNQNNIFGGSNLTGTVNEDFLIDGIINKIRFFKGFDTEIILHIDRHNFIPTEILKKLQGLCDVLIIRKHTEEPNFNDNSYIRALQLATGDIVFHFDQDCAAFTSTENVINDFISLLDKYDYVSYPSHWTPRAVDDKHYDYDWCSTRFFLCKRETLDFNEIKKCLSDYEYMFLQYPTERKNHWLEHILGLISKYKGKGVYYPPMDIEKYAIWSWGSYRTGLLKQLNEMDYEGVKQFVNNNGGIVYPNDINLK